MAKRIADVLVDVLAETGVRRIYGFLAILSTRRSFGR
jgi:hypothetical protein